MRAFTHRRAVVVLLVAGTLDAIGGLLFSLTEHIAIGNGLFWAVGTATTAGAGSIVPVNPAGKTLAVLVELTVIPLFAATFSLITTRITEGHLKREAKVLHDCLDGVDAKASHIIFHSSEIPNDILERSED